MGLIVVTGASSGIGAATARALAGQPHAELLLVARRADRLAALAAELPCPAHPVPVDLTADDAPVTVAAAVDEHGGRLALLVNNAGSGARGTFAQTGYAGVARTMALNFDATVRLTEALLPALRAGVPSAVVNVASTAARVSRPGTGGYSASKAALAAWSDCLAVEERRHGVHVALVLPGFVATEGFPAAELMARRVTRWTVGDVDQAARAIVDAADHRRDEVYVPRGYRLIALARTVTPGLVRAVLRGPSGRLLMTRTGADPPSDG